jgi:hypothetical protein
MGVAQGSARGSNFYHLVRLGSSLGSVPYLRGSASPCAQSSPCGDSSTQRAFKVTSVGTRFNG